MKLITSLIYNLLIIRILYLVFLVGSVFNNKIRKGLTDRKKLFSLLEASAKKLNRQKKTIWFHSSSVGEFEQAKPIIEELRKRFKLNIVVSFFSPSGYHSAKKYQFADIVTYIPFDTTGNVKKFFNIIAPSVAVVMRYDIWPNAVWELEKRKIPVFLVDATMRKNSARKIFPFNMFHNVLFSGLTKILAISESDKNGFMAFGLNEELIEVVGDTRYDRVYYRRKNAPKTKLLSESIIKDKKIFIAGSTWPEDEQELLPCIIKLHQKKEGLLTIIVPHEPTVENIEFVESQLKDEIKTIRFSLLNQYDGEEIIVIDSIGILLGLYSYSHVAFVGGGFKSNIHNVLEPAVYGIPVIFGPKHSGSQEVSRLIKAGGGFQVEDKQDIYRLLKTFFDNEAYRTECGENARLFVESNIGATEITIKYLIPYLS